MKTSLFFGLCLILSFGLSAQIKFEAGYILTDKNERIECLIKNMDWRNSPNEIIYKFSDDKEELKLITSQINEFGIYGNVKYKKFTVQIDRDIFTDERNGIFKNKDPKFNNESLLIKCLLEGKANLFLYEENDLKRFFYNVDNTEIKQFIYKRYLVHIDTMKNEGMHLKGDQPLKVLENNKYKNQLWADLYCEGISMNDIETLSYFEKPLLKIFKKYNDYHKSEYTVYKKIQKTSALFNFYLQAGSNYSSLQMSNEFFNLLNMDIDFEGNFGYRVGIDAEFIAPYNNNKWALSFNPSYNTYRTEKKLQYIQFSTITYFTNVIVDFKFIELPMVLKYYIYLNNDSKFNINASFILDYFFNSSINYEAIELKDMFPMQLSRSSNFGLGYVYKNKYSVTFKYQSNKSILKNYMNWIGNYRIMSLTLGYNLMGLFNK
jgi:hypothetical protein